MRPVHLTDLDLAARAVLAQPAGAQPDAAARLVAGARLADRFRKRLGRRHSVWGDGTVAAAAMALAGGKLAPPQRCDTAYRHALQSVLTALSESGPFDFPQQTLYPMRGTARKVCNGLYSGETS